MQCLRAAAAYLLHVAQSLLYEVYDMHMLGRDLSLAYSILQAYMYICYNDPSVRNLLVDLSVVCESPDILPVNMP